MNNTEDSKIKNPEINEDQGGKDYLETLYEQYMPETGTKVSAETKLGVDLSEFTDNIPISVSLGNNSIEDLMKLRADYQSTGSKMANGLGRVISAVPMAIGQVASAFDFEDYINQDGEIGNEITRTMNEVVESINESMPIYTRSEESDAGDIGYWIKNISSLASSVASFAMTGAITGGAIGLLGSAANRLKWFASLSDDALKFVNAAKTTGNAIMLNQAEGVGVAMDVYNTVYEQKKGLVDKLSKEKEKLSLNAVNAEGIKDQKIIDRINEIDKILATTDPEKDAIAAAETTLKVNRANVLLNLTSAGKFFTSPKLSRQLREQFKLTKGVGHESVQEAGEEWINLVAEKSGLRRGAGEEDLLTNISGGMGDAASAEGLEAMFWGALGGAGNTMLVNAGRTTKYNPASRVKDPETGEYISSKVHQNKLYEAQQERFKFEDEIKSVVGAPKLIELLSRGDKHATTVKEYQEALDNGDLDLADRKLDEMLANEAFSAFENGTTDNFVNVLEEAAKKNEENPESDSKTIATKLAKAKELTEVYEGFFNKSKAYLGSDEVYNNLVNQHSIKEQLSEKEQKLEVAKSKLDARAAKVSKKYTVQTPIREDISSTTSEPIIYNIEDLDNVENRKQPGYSSFMEELERTQELEEFSSINKAVNDLNTGLENFEAQYKNITSKETQGALKDEMDKFRSLDETVKEAHKKDIADIEKMLEDESNEPIKEKLQSILEVKKEELKKKQRENAAKNKAKNDSEQEVVVEENVEEEVQQTPPEAQEPQVQDPVVPEEAVPETNPEDSQEFSRAGEVFTNEDSELDNDYNGAVEGKQSSQESVETLEKDNENHLKSGVKRAYDKMALKTREYEETDEGYKDVDDALAEGLNPTVLNFNKVKEGTDIVLKPTANPKTKVTNKQGETVTWGELEPTLSSEEKLDMTPIEVQTTDGEVLAYVHTAEWIHRNISEEHVESNLAYNRAIRQAVISKKEVKTKVNFRTAGLLFKTHDGSYNSAKEMLKDPNLQVGVVKSGEIYLNSGKVFKGKLLNDTSKFRKGVKGSDKSLNGHLMAILPVNDGVYIAVPLKSEKLKQEVRQTILEAIQAYTNPKEGAEVVKKILDKTGIDISTNRGLYEFLNLYTKVYSHGPTTLKDKGFQDDYFASLTDISKPLISIHQGPKRSSVYIMSPGTEGFGTNGLLEIKIGQNNPKALEVLTDTIMGASIYTATNKAELTEETPIVHVKDGVVTEAHPNHKDYVLTNYTTNIVGNKVDEDKDGNPVYAYTSSPIIRFDSKFAEEHKKEESQKSKGDYTLISSLNPDGNLGYDIMHSEDGIVTDGQGNLTKEQAEAKLKELNSPSKENQPDEYKSGEYKKGDIVTPDIVVKDELSTFDNTTIQSRIEEGNNAGLNSKIVKINGVSEKGVSADIRIVTPAGASVFTVFLKNSSKNVTTKKASPNTQEDSVQQDITDFLSDFNLDETDDLPSSKIDTLAGILIQNNPIVPGLRPAQQHQIVLSIINQAISMLKSDKDNISLKEAYDEAVKKQLKAGEALLQKFKDKGVTEAQIEHLKTTTPDLKRALDIYNALKNHKQKLIQEANITASSIGILDIKKVSNNKQEDTTDEAEQNNWDDDYQLSLNSKKTVGAQLKKWLAFIPDQKVQIVEGVLTYTTKKNVLKQDKFVDFDTAYDTLHKILAGSSTDFNKAIERLEAYISNLETNAKTSGNTEVLNNIAWLRSTVDNLKEAPQQVKNQFITDMVKHNVNMKYHYWSIRKDKTTGEKYYSITTLNANSLESQELVLQEWRKGFISSDLMTTSFTEEDGVPNLSFTVDQEALEVYGAMLEEYRKSDDITREDIKTIFNHIGIQVSDILIETLYLGEYTPPGSNTPVQRENLFEKGNLFGNIYNNLKNAKTREFSNSLPIDTPEIKSLSVLDSKYRARNTPNVFKVGTKSIYTYTNNHYLFRVFENLKDPEHREKILKEFMGRHSSWAKEMASEDSNANLEFFTYSLNPLKKAKSTSDYKAEFSDKGDTDHELAKMSGFFGNNGFTTLSTGKRVRNAHYSFFTTSDKSVIRGVKSWAIEAIDKRGNLSMDGINQIYDLVFEAERARIASVDLADKINTKTYAEGKNIFYLLPSLNHVEIDIDGEQVNLRKAVEEGAYNPKKHKEVITDHIKGQIRNLTEKKLAFWEESGIGQTVTVESRSGKKSSTVNNKFIDKTYIENLPSRVKTNEDILEHAATDLVFNEMLAYANMASLVLKDPAQYYKSKSKDVNQQVLDTYDNIGKRLAAEVAPGSELANAVNNNYLQVFLKDLDAESSNMQEYKKVLKAKSAAYANIESTDAQEYTTWQEHLYILYTQGNINDAEMKEAWRAFSKNEEPNPELFDKVMQPLKPVYSGYKEIELDNSLYHKKMYIKSSSIPLIPSLTKGLGLDNLRVAMETIQEEQNTKLVGNVFKSVSADEALAAFKDGSYVPVRASYGTATKVGFPKKPLNIFGEGGKILSSDDILSNIKEDVNEDPAITKLSREWFRIQMDVPFKDTKTAITRSSQAVKLLFSNIQDIEGFKYKGKEYEGKELKNKFDELNDKLIDLKIEALGEKVFDTDKYGSQTLSFPKLQKILLEEAVGRDYGFNAIQGLELNEAGTDFKTPLWASPYMEQYMSLINSLVTNGVAKDKPKGFSFVLASDAGFTSDEDFDFLTNNIVWANSEASLSQGLKPMREEGGVIKPAQILVKPIITDAEGKLIDIQQFIVVDENTGKKYLDTKKIPKNVLEGFGFRIPNQGHNSMSYVEIVGFLPRTSGDSVVAPKEFITQMGSDFDVDKLYSYFKHTEFKDGKVSVIKGQDTIEGVRNELLDIYFSVLSSTDKRVKSEIMAPLAFGDLKTDAANGEIYRENEIESSEFVKNVNEAGGIANYIEQLRTSDSEVPTLLSSDYHRQKYMTGRSGKAGIGIFSLDSVFHATIQGKELFLQMSSYGDPAVTFGNHTNHILGKSKTLAGNKYISDVIKALQSAAVDNEKEQILNKININSHTFGAIKAMALLGFEEDVIAAFISQDIIVDYSLELDKLDSATQEFTENKEETALRNVLDKYGVPESFEEDAHLADFKGQDPVKDMLQHIGKGKESPKVQAAVLKKFLKLTEAGDEITSLETLINIDSKGVGKDTFRSNAKYENIKEKLEDNSKVIIGGRSAIFKNNNNKITGVVGKGSVESLKFSSHFNSLFSPVLDVKFNEVVDKLAYLEGKTFKSSDAKADYTKQVAKEYSSYLFSRMNNVGMDANLVTYRKYLYGIGDNDFASKIDRLVGSDLFNKNEFLRNLTVTSPTDKRYNRKQLIYAVSDDTRTTGKHLDTVGIIELSQLKEVPEELRKEGYNSVEEFLRDLTAYEVLRGTNKKYGGYLEFLPLPLFNELFKDSFTAREATSSSLKHFQVQYARHRIKDLKVTKDAFGESPLSNYDTKLQGRVYKDKKGKNMPMTIVDEDSKGNKSLWALTDRSKLLYTKFNELGTERFNEYAFDQHIDSVFNNNTNSKLGAVDSNNEGYLINPPLNAVEALGIKPNMTAAEILNVVKGNSPEYAPIIKKIEAVIGDVELEVLTPKEGKIGGNFSVDKSKDKHIHKVTLNLPSVESKSNILEAITHEFIHAATSLAINNPQNYSKEVQKYVNQLNHLRELTIEKISSHPQILKRASRTLVSVATWKKDKYPAHAEKHQAIIDKYSKHIEGETAPTIADLNRDMYALYDTKEFVVGILVNKEFRELLDIPYGNKTLATKVLELIQNLLHGLGLNVDINFLLKPSEEAALNLLDELASPNKEEEAFAKGEVSKKDIFVDNNKNTSTDDLIEGVNSFKFNDFFTIPLNKDCS